MATIKHRVTKSVRSNAGTVGGVAYEISGTAEINIFLDDHAIGANTPQDFALDVSTAVSVAMLWEPASGSSSATVYTNDVSGGSPDNTIVLLADKPLFWDTQVLATLGTACPFTVDVDAGLFITTTAIGDLTIYVLTSGS